ncbi:hypothetical protein C8Q80DRAFT_337563 [Daedaleopsis nitida]|nr:hypothetical protein C8Q80DRAFT_337563 [Daedaleopsis nitida]
MVIRANRPLFFSPPDLHRPHRPTRQLRRHPVRCSARPALAVVGQTRVDSVLHADFVAGIPVADTHDDVQHMSTSLRRNLTRCPDVAPISRRACEGTDSRRANHSETWRLPSSHSLISFSLVNRIRRIVSLSCAPTTTARPPRLPYRYWTPSLRPMKPLPRTLKTHLTHSSKRMQCSMLFIQQTLKYLLTTAKLSWRERSVQTPELFLLTADAQSS